MHSHSSRLLLFVVAAAADAVVGIYVIVEQKKHPHVCNATKLTFKIQFLFELLHRLHRGMKGKSWEFRPEILYLSIPLTR